MHPQQTPHALTQLHITRASSIQVGGTLSQRQLKRRRKYLHVSNDLVAHAFTDRYDSFLSLEERNGNQTNDS
jgi:hypothetical protein